MFDQALIEKLFPTPADVPFSLPHLQGATVVVTGAGGFIGSHLCETLSFFSPARIVLVESCEYALYEVHRKLTELNRQEIYPILGDCGDQPLMEQVFKKFKPDVVYHAAAYKHVPLVERNPFAGVKNNVLASQSLFEVVAAQGVPSLVVVSTDKAVNPTNVMGATKRLVEYFALTSRVKKVKVVRFGNVLGSTGSVVPLFYDQLMKGRPVTVTDPHVDRYLMSVRQAVSLILECSPFKTGIYVFDMGSPIRIADLPSKMAHLLGIKNFSVKFVGLRPGEKLHEELTLGKNLQETTHPKIMFADESIPAADYLHLIAFRLRSTVMRRCTEDLLHLLEEAVPGYQSSTYLNEEAQTHDCYRIPAA